MKTRKYLLNLILLVLTISIAGCASGNLTAPCPNFGANCKKIPVNSWNYQQ